MPTLDPRSRAIGKQVFRVSRPGRVRLPGRGHRRAWRSALASRYDDPLAGRDAEEGRALSWMIRAIVSRRSAFGATSRRSTTGSGRAGRRRASGGVARRSRLPRRPHRRSARSGRTPATPTDGEQDDEQDQPAAAGQVHRHRCAAPTRAGASGRQAQAGRQPARAAGAAGCGAGGAAGGRAGRSAHAATGARAVDRGCGHAGLLGRDRTDVRSNACTSSNTWLRHSSSDTSNTCLKLLYEPPTVGTESRDATGRRRAASCRLPSWEQPSSDHRQRHRRPGTTNQLGEHRGGPTSGPRDRRHRLMARTSRRKTASEGRPPRPGQQPARRPRGPVHHSRAGRAAGGQAGREDRGRRPRVKRGRPSNEVIVEEYGDLGGGDGMTARQRRVLEEIRDSVERGATRPACARSASRSG